MDSSTTTPVTTAVETFRTRFRAAGSLPISTQQALGRKDPGVRGPIWVSRTTFPVSEDDDVLQTLIRVIRNLGEGTELISWPHVIPVEAEWTGYRAGVSQKAPEPAISEEEKYMGLMRDVSNPITILYIHGGSFIIGDPSTSRPAVVRIAQATGGRCLSVRYRLAPQNPFPAALLDIFVTYLSLLSPPPGSLHKAVPAPSIILAGDSAGAALCLSLIQIIREIRRQQSTSTPSVRFHGRDVTLSMPAGVTGISPAGEFTLSLPSWMGNAKHDIFRDEMPNMKPGFPSCKVWPSNPPRGATYCDTSALCHPLVSPAVAKSWIGAPPMWFACGQERMADSAKLIAQTAARDGVCVLFEEYEAMPHLWTLFFRQWPQSVRCFEGLAQACKQFVEGVNLTSRGTSIDLRMLSFKELDVKNLTPLTVEEALVLMKDKVGRMKVWTGKENFRARL